jgi:hypothetical protein
LTRTIRCPDCGREVNVSSRPYHGTAPNGPALRLSVHRPIGGGVCPGSGRAVDCVHCGAEHDFAGELCAACGQPPFAEVPSGAEGDMPGRGGKREGAGRPPERGEAATHQIGVKLNDAEIEMLDAVRPHLTREDDEKELSRQEVLRRALVRVYEQTR